MKVEVAVLAPPPPPHPRPNEPYGFCGRKATLNHAHALVTDCPQYTKLNVCLFDLTSEDIKLHIIINLTGCVMESRHKGVKQRSKYVTQVEQQKPDSPTVTLIGIAYGNSRWHALKYNVYKLHQRYILNSLVC